MATIRTTTLAAQPAQIGAVSTIATGMGGPFVLLSDLTTLVGNVNSNKHRLATCQDGGTTWTQGAYFINGNYSINGIIETLDSEILVSLKGPSGSPGLVFRSKGWNPATARGATISVTAKALTSNVATLTTSVAHGFSVGQYVYVSGVDVTFNGSNIITAVTSTTFSFAKTASDVSSTGAAGLVDAWSLVLTCSGADSWCDGRWGFNQRSVAPSWSRRPGEIFIAEYGKHTNEVTPNQAAIRAWRSKDHGRTWAVAFNLRDQLPGLDAATIHMHGVAYDPWDDRVLVAHGDGGQGDGGRCGILWCDGESLDTPVWMAVPGSVTTSSFWQTTTLIPMETGILLMSDGGPYGVNRLARRGYRRYGPLQAVAPLGNAIIGSNAWRNNGYDPGAPVLLSYIATANSGPPSMILTIDGENFVELVRDSSPISNGAPGYTNPVGPDILGNLYWSTNISGSGALAIAQYIPSAITI